MRLIEITGSDDQMDCRNSFGDVINPLPSKCPRCGFPNLDHIPQPYFLIKSRTLSPDELALAAYGNFFVRPRIRRVLDLLAPGQCDYFPTCYEGTSQETPWQLAVPKHQVVTARVNPSIPRCSGCGEPRSAHPGTQFVEYFFGTPHRGQPLGQGWTCESEHEVLKASTWGSSERGWKLWITREVFLSVRLFHLLKRIKAKGFRANENAPADESEPAWIKEKLRVVEMNGIPLDAPGTMSEADSNWFRDYIETHASNVEERYDIKELERTLKCKVPRSYVEFITKVGPVSFADLDEQEGFNVTILPPNEIDSEMFRADALESEDEETNAIDGVMFATTEHGDCFCFDANSGEKELPVYLYKHEYNCFEPYAENFATCVRRFAGGG